jgi:phosphatidylglycerophosphate synthase
MTACSPTIAELRARVQKDRHREIGNWLARRVARPTAVYGCWLAIRLGLSAHQVTLLALGSWLLAAVSIGTGDRLLFIIGVALLQFGFWLDHVDGQVARWRGTVSLDGVYLDYVMHHVANLSLGFALGFGLAVKFGDVRWTIAGFAIAVGWAGLSLHNDCRYKAFFQRLKSTTYSYRVDGGGGGRPQPPSPWPRRGRAAFTWPAFKACEIHVVTVALAAMALLAVVSPRAWVFAWQAVVLSLAVLAPSLAIGRTARSVALSAAESEFSRWFKPAGHCGDPARKPAERRPLDRRAAGE